jgi:GNAT superfamily N-acetyltransferase
MDIREAVTQSEWEEVYGLLLELRTDLGKAEFSGLLQEMRKEGYRVFCLYNEKVELVSLAGVIIRTNFYAKRHVFIYDLVTKSSERSKGYGKKLLQYVEEWGAQQNCESAGLDSGLQRKDAHRFYEHAMQYNKSSYAFRKKL